MDERALPRDETGATAAAAPTAPEPSAEEVAQALDALRGYQRLATLVTAGALTAAAGALFAGARLLRRR